MPDGETQAIMDVLTPFISREIIRGHSLQDIERDIQDMVTDVWKQLGDKS